MTPDQPAETGEITIIAVAVVHPQGYGEHEFEYQPRNDLFACTRCGGYEVSLRDRTTGQIRPCPGPTTTTGEDTDHA